MDARALDDAFRLQAGGCRHFGSEFYAALVEAAHADLRAGGPVARLVEGWQGDPLRGYLPLRILGAVHERVLSGLAPELAPYYPSVGGRADAAAAWPAFRALIERNADALRPRLATFPQTNEVRRSAGLLGGFLEVAARTRLPLRLLEIGTSAGLNLLWDRFAYELGPHRWGDPGSPVRIAAAWHGPPAAFGAPAGVASRAGCDLSPRDVRQAGDVRILEAFVWADQPERLEQLRAAVALARQGPPRVERAAAADWLPGELARDAEGTCRVVFHSSVWIYIEAAEQARIRALLDEAGARATPSRPLAWLRHEDTEARPGAIDVRVTLWPPGAELHLGHGHPHGREVRWLGAGAAEAAAEAPQKV